MIIVGLEPYELLLECLDEGLLGFVGDFLFKEGAFGFEVFEDGGVLEFLDEIHRGAEIE
jgi:hypothetical protein